MAETARGCVVTIGVFDGFHEGHKAVVAAAVHEARRLDVPCVLMTFSPHPLLIVAPDRAPRLLMSLRERLDAALAAGVDETVVVRFTARFAGTSAAQFISDTLVDGLSARTVVVGTNFKFGCENSGDVGTLRAAGLEAGFEVIAVPMVTIDGEICSSTRIRRMSIRSRDARLINHPVCASLRG